MVPTLTMAEQIAADVEPTAGTVVQVFSGGAMLQVFLPAHGITAEDVERE